MSAKRADNKSKGARKKGEKKDYAILLAGVNGQGVGLCADIISDALLFAGYDVKNSGLCGLSGSKYSHIRYGAKVYSPFIQEGCADILLSFENLEALRHLASLKKGGSVVMNNEENLCGIGWDGVKYPEMIIDRVQEKAEHFACINALDIAEELGSRSAFNILLLGVLSQYLELDNKHYVNALKGRLDSDSFDLKLNIFKEGQKL